MSTTITVNRAPVLALWSAVVARRLGHDEDAALTLGKAVAGFTAQAKGRNLGIYGSPSSPVDRPGAAPKKSGLGEDCFIELCGRAIPARHTPEGLRACVLDKTIEPDSVRAYLAKAFGDRLGDVRSAMEALAGSLEPSELAPQAFTSLRGIPSRRQPRTGGMGAEGDARHRDDPGDGQAGAQAEALISPAS